MTIKVLFFAQLRDYAQTDSVELNAEPGMLVRDLLVKLKGLVNDRLLDELDDQTAMVSVNHKYAGWEAELIDGDEVGILPPVSGG